MSNKAILSAATALAGMVLASFSLSSAAEETTEEIRALLLSPEQWLARTHGEFHYDSDTKNPRFSLESVQPLFLSQDLMHTIFAQGRISLEDGDWTGNIGVGYRYLMNDASLLFGVNAWYDRMWNPGHERIGLGAEFIGGYLDLRANWYNGISGWKVKDGMEERALDGYDFSLEGPVPYMPWMRLNVGYYHWDALEGVKDVNGFRGELTMDVTQQLQLSGGVHADNKDTTAFVKLSLSLGGPTHRQFTMVDTGVTPEPFVKRDLRKMVLMPVKRQHRIVLQRRKKGQSGGGIVVGRS